jgi:hypothetical protein
LKSTKSRLEAVERIVNPVEKKRLFVLFGVPEACTEDKKDELWDKAYDILHAKVPQLNFLKVVMVPVRYSGPILEWFIS